MNRTIGLAAGAVLAAVAVPSLAQAENAFTTDLVNLRSGPGYDYPVVFAVPGRQAITSYDCLKDWSWSDVSVGDYLGWMVGDYIAYASSSGWVPVYEYGPRYQRADRQLQLRHLVGQLLSRPALVSRSRALGRV